MPSGTHRHLSFPSVLLSVWLLLVGPEMAPVSLASPLYSRAEVEMQQLLFMGSKAHPGVYISFSRMGHMGFLRCRQVSVFSGTQRFPKQG